MKIHLVVAELFHADGRTDEANNCFSSKNGITVESISLNLLRLKSTKTVYPHFLQITMEPLHKLNRLSHSKT